MRFLSYRSLIPVGAMLALLLPLSALADDFTKEFSFDAEKLEVANLIGEVTVTEASGDEFRVIVHVQGDDAEESLIEFDEDKGRTSRLAVLFPVDDHRKYVYPELGRRSQTQFHFDEDGEKTWFSRLFGGKKITVKGSGKGLEMWADLEIAVPAGSELIVKLGAGEAHASGVRGDVVLDTHSGAVSGHDIDGNFTGDTGSGSVEIENVEGDVLADTGSGSVKVRDVRGEVSVDTGSGGVSVDDAKGDKVHVDTGSGSVHLDQITCENLHVDTGSGKVVARGVKTDQARIDTGSGSVVLELDEMGSGRFVIDTGSGGIELALPKNASARIEADTGSGRVRNRIEDADVDHQEKDEILMSVGDGDARVTLDAGSGSITIRRL
ncbi:MAG: DUF4097 domain-containing protein [bacterium]|nr:DUF4097 domain-containing protein [bacterium]